MGSGGAAQAGCQPRQAPAHPGFDGAQGLLQMPSQIAVAQTVKEHQHQALPVARVKRRHARGNARAAAPVVEQVGAVAGLCIGCRVEQVFVEPCGGPGCYS